MSTYARSCSTLRLRFRPGAGRSLLAISLALGLTAGCADVPGVDSTKRADTVDLRRAINRLGAAENVLEAADINYIYLIESIYDPDDPLYSPPPEPATLGRLGAIALQVGVADERVAAVLAFHPPIPCDPDGTCHPPEPGLVAALLAVQEDADAIVARSEDVLHPPEPGRPPPDDTIAGAIANVLSAGQSVSDRIETYLGASSCDVGCSAAYDECLLRDVPREQCASELTACTDDCERAACDADCASNYDACLGAGGDPDGCAAALDRCLGVCAPDACVDDCGLAFDRCVAAGGDYCSGDLEACVGECMLGSPG